MGCSSSSTSNVEAGVTEINSHTNGQLNKPFENKLRNSEFRSTVNNSETTLDKQYNDHLISTSASTKNPITNQCHISTEQGGSEVALQNTDIFQYKDNKEQHGNYRGNPKKTCQIQNTYDNALSDHTNKNVSDKLEKIEIFENDVEDVKLVALSKERIKEEIQPKEENYSEKSSQVDFDNDEKDFGLQNTYNDEHDEKIEQTLVIREQDTHTIDESLIFTKNYDSKDQQFIPKLIEEISEKTGTSSKKLSINFENFKEIDDHARKAPDSVKTSVERLAEYLTACARDELEVVRAFYVWICENISYDVESYFSDVKSAITDADGVLGSGKSVCEGYANLFLALCKAKDITCKKLSGYAKGYSHKPGNIISYDSKTNHAWNVVYLQHSWYFIETTWGGGYLGEDKQTVKQFTDFYFLTPPEYFINDHFPYIEKDIEESKRWQLLEQPITIEEYSERVKLSQEARQLRIKFPENAYEIVKVTNSTKILVDSSDNPLKQVMYDLFSESRVNHNQSVMIIQESRSQFTIHLHPESSGRYFLNIFGSIHAEGSCSRLVQFVIDCESTSLHFEPFPKYRQFYGAKPDFEQRGFIFEELRPFHTSTDGEYTVEMKTSSSPDVSATLYDIYDDKEDGFSLLERLDHCVRVRTRLRKIGYYKLIIFSRVGDDTSYSVACTLLIENLQSSPLTSQFPKTYSTTAEYNCQLLMPLTRTIPANSEVHIKFISSKIADLLVKAAGKYEIVHEDSNETWDVMVKTKESGSVKISGNVTGNGSYWTIFEFSIN